MRCTIGVKEFRNKIVLISGFGSACHLGVSLKLPCVGVAKKLFQVDGLEKDESHHKKVRRHRCHLLYCRFSNPLSAG